MSLQGVFTLQLFLADLTCPLLLTVDRVDVTVVRALQGKPFVAGLTVERLALLVNAPHVILEVELVLERHWTFAALMLHLQMLCLDVTKEAVFAKEGFVAVRALVLLAVDVAAFVVVCQD